MSEIKVEKPSEEQLKQLEVDSWSTWECDVSTFDWRYGQEEVAYVLEGKVTVKTSQGAVTITKGDLVTFPQGLACTWNVLEPIKKRYTFR